jgi:hypothetical protein
MLAEWTALTIVTFAPPRLSVPPLPKPTVWTPWPFSHSETSWMQCTFAPSFPASRAASEAWSPWAWVRRIWVAPATASSSRSAWEHRVAGQPGVDKEDGVLDFDPKAGMAKPGDFHACVPSECRLK